MASNSSASIESLPVEIFHRIFDHLDAQTILYSIQLVCRLLRSIVKSYDRYKFDFKIISKSNFHRLCRLIPPQRLISLTLYHNEQIPDQTSFFVSTYRLRQLTRLHSINLMGIDECHLNFILKRINPDRLTSFSLRIREYDARRKKTTEHQIFSILAQSSLRKIELNIRNYRLEDIQWPPNCQIESLILNEGISINNLFRIMSSSPQLHTLVIKEKLMNIPYNADKKYNFPQIKSLTLGKVDTTFEYLQSFLSLIPSLTYLKLSGHGVFDGKQWEEFIQVNLLHLNNFEFLINSFKSTDQTRDDLQLILQSFQSPFWIEHKKWFVACTFRPYVPRRIQIYSIPICKTIFNDELDSKTCCLSTSNHLLNLSNINEIDLKSKHLANSDLLKSIDTPFPTVTKLSLEIYSKTPTDSIDRLQSIFNMSQLIEVHLESSGFDNDNKDFLFAMVKLLNKPSKLTSLRIHNNLWNYGIYAFLNDLCSILPRQIKYLEIPISQLEQVEIIFERCPYLSIVKFNTRRRKISMEVAEWFDQNTIDSTFRREGEFSHVWIGKKINQVNENRKRIKLMDNESN